jgi:metacaspase-1
VATRHSKKERAPRGLAVSIGLNDLDERYYGGEYERLKGAEEDARRMARLARSNGFESTILLGPKATWKRVTGKIKKAAADLTSGDIFLLTFSGHGSVIRPSWIERNVDPWPASVKVGEWVQTWVLWDRELVDKEMRKIWMKFRQGVRVLVVLDSCHSFSAIETQGYVKWIADRKVRAAKRSSSPLVPLRFRMLSEQLQASVLDRNRGYYARKLREAPTAESARDSTVARVLALTACLDNQLANDGDPLGLFTEELLAAYNSKKEKNYTSLLESVSQAVSRRALFQTPGLNPYPDNKSFSAERPFTITADG